MDKVIVTGVNGFVGNHLVDELISQNYEVIGVGREDQLSPELTDRVKSYYVCDLADYESVKSLPLAGAKAIINLAGLAAVGPSFDNPELYMRINTAVLDTVCKAALEQDANDMRILTISSGAIYSANQRMPLTENSALAPESSPYAASKIAMEELSLKYRDEGLDCVVARPFNHIGPGQLEGFLLPDLYKKVTESQESGDPLLVGNLTTRRDYTDVRDVAKAYVKLVESDNLKHGIYNVCTGRSLSGEEILEKLVQVLNLTEVVSQVDESLFRPSDTPELYGDNTRLKTDTGWEPQIPIEQTIRDFVNSKQ
jgi:GDP-4-dehydro-6-deoxy-D-mannose reductase